MDCLKTTFRNVPSRLFQSCRVVPSRLFQSKIQAKYTNTNKPTLITRIIEYFNENNNVLLSFILKTYDSIKSDKFANKNLCFYKKIIILLIKTHDFTTTPKFVDENT